MAAPTVRLGSFVTHTPEQSYSRLVVEAKPLWDELERLGEARLITPTGALDFGEHRHPERLSDVLAQLGVEHELLGAHRAAERWPQFTFDTPVLWHPGAGVIDAQRAVETMVAQAVEHGALLLTDWTVKRVDRRPSGYRLISSHGDQVLAEQVVVCAGGWLPELLSDLSLPPGFLAAMPSLEVRQEQAYHFPYRDEGPASGGTLDGAAWPTFIYKDQQIQTYGLPGGSDADHRGQKVAEYNGGKRLASASMQDQVVDPTNRRRMVAYVEQHLPGLVAEPYAETTCLFTNTPHEDFVLDRAEAVTVVSPCSGHGAKFAPLSAHGRRTCQRSQQRRTSRTGSSPISSHPRLIARDIFFLAHERNSCLVSPVSVTSLLSDIAGVGTDRVRGGYSRPVSRPRNSTFARGSDPRPRLAASTSRRTATESSGVGSTSPAASDKDAVVTGSHLDSVPGGGAYDGPLGVASALVALDLLRARQHIPDRPLAIAVFPEEEGSRFGLACLGSGLMAGSVDVNAALRLTDVDGDSLADVMARNNLDPRHVGPDREALARVGTFVELHVEQGRGLVDLAQPVAIGSSIIAHGRWRLTVSGQGNHAGTTLMAARQDPMTVAARIVLAIQDTAQATPLARATVGRLIPIPGGANVIASRVQMWLDVRHPDDDVVRALVSTILQRAGEAAAQQGCAVQLREESYSPTARFDSWLQRRLSTVLPDAPIIATGAGHDAGVRPP